MKTGHTRSDLVNPASWLVTNDGKWMAYEFKYNPLKDTSAIDLDDEKYSAFMLEITSALQAANLTFTLGLRVWPRDGFRGGLEFTEGKTNVFMEIGEFDKADQANEQTVTVCWYFDPAFEAEQNNGYDCIWRKNGFHSLTRTCD